ncbi:unnamed protein product [marine sediment metagenome]|uniref:Uncharacterized protein n=1 Tax=marine sediment metagenome TaxID=412755 RepID=X1IPD5_9ZZZZ
MSDIVHDCDDRPSGLRRHAPYWEPKYRGWRMRDGTLSYRVNHCPYCGQKLEPPDVKIEVNREVLVEMVNALWAAQQHITGVIHPLTDD